MATYFNDIQAAFDNRLNTLTGGYDIAWSNIVYEPDVGTTYLRPSFLPTDTVQVGLGSSGLDDTRGVYQIDVVYPAGNGRTTVTDSVADHFKRGTTLSYNGTNVRIISASIGPALRDGAWNFVPVSIAFQTYTDAR